MCSQFHINVELKKLSKEYDAFIEEEFEWRPHVFPRYNAPVIILDGKRRIIKRMHFGLIPFYEKNPKPKKVFHNARSETLSEKISFKKIYPVTRCLVPMNSFFEYIWTSDTEKWLARFYSRNENTLVAAGLWSRWQSPEGKIIDNFTIITKEPPKFIKDTGHDRCPVFLNDDVRAKWLDPTTKDLKALDSLLAIESKIEFNVEEMKVR